LQALPPGNAYAPFAPNAPHIATQFSLTLATFLLPRQRPLSSLSVTVTPRPVARLFRVVRIRVSECRNRPYCCRKTLRYSRSAFCSNCRSGHPGLQNSIFWQTFQPLGLNLDPSQSQHKSRSASPDAMADRNGWQMYPFHHYEAIMIFRWKQNGDNGYGV